MMGRLDFECLIAEAYATGAKDFDLRRSIWSKLRVDHVERVSKHWFPIREKITIFIPYPPSVNKLWRSVNGRSIKSAEYRGWERACEVHRIHTSGSIKGKYKLLLEAQRPDKRRRDIGNLEKAASDMLVHLGVIRDDCDAEEITLRWVNEDLGGFCRLTITAVGDEESHG